MLPNKEIISPTHSGNLNLSPALSSTVQQSLVYPNITNKSLLSIFKNDILIIQGTINTKDGLWDVPFQDPNTSIHSSTTSPKNLALNHIIQRDKTKSGLARYLHGCVFSPVFSTFSEEHQ